MEHPSLYSPVSKLLASFIRGEFLFDLDDGFISISGEIEAGCIFYFWRVGGVVGHYHEKITLKFY